MIVFEKTSLVLGDNSKFFYVLFLSYSRGLFDNKTMKILLIFRFFYYTWFIDSENLFYSNFERKNYKGLTFNNVHSANFEISASL